MKLKTNDTVVSVLVSGSIATVIQMIISWGLYFLGLIQQNPSFFHARLLTNKFVVTTGELMLGIFGNFIAGIGFAAIIVVLLVLTGTDYAVLKGALIGLINGMLQFYILSRLFYDPALLVPDVLTIIHVYAVYTIWGVIVAYISSRYFNLRVKR